MLQLKRLWKEREELLMEGRRSRKDLEDTRVEVAYERSLRREHQGHAYLLAKERERLLRMVAKERCAAPHPRACAYELDQVVRASAEVWWVCVAFNGGAVT